MVTIKNVLFALYIGASIVMISAIVEKDYMRFFVAGIFTWLLLTYQLVDRELGRSKKV
jgi:hypothetical protein